MGLRRCGSPDAYEREAREVLCEAGYPDSLQELIQVEKKERRIRDIMGMLSWFRGARIALEIEDANHAAWNMAFGVKAALAARLRPRERYLEMGERSSETGQQNRAKKEKHFGITDAQRDERNQAMVEEFKKINLNRKKPMTRNEFVNKYAEKYYLKPNSAAKILRKLLPR